ncbi:TonB-dependent receptor [Novosphingobium resinovorum]|uniref:TonB-dependent receptor n=1 Tax=Novosphingobium resinovorum TaxID=158500 RepID=A0A031JLP7_9SPHN|nr:TonB-dependent receptor [Novosphingobium resinovorum]AOR79355.1 TonB-dependent receptor [Novosphingobium resinovorum]EZP76602.1 TonB-dependent receptor [Novosphingobium resinovorum]
MTSKSWLAAGIGIAALTIAMPALAQVRNFNIPAQDLGTALSRLAHQADIQIVAPDAVTRRFRSHAVQGQMETRAAIARMIEGSGLVVASDSGSVVVLAAGNDGEAASGPKAESVEPEAAEIVVTGAHPIAESEAAALARQRASDSLVSVVASDSVGRMPDQNMAQALGRIPGVAIQRDQGRARYLNLRGAPKNWTTVSFDGINVISPGGRQTLFDTIPAAIASQVVVRKAVTPDMTGETVAGNIDIVTRSGFDFPGLHVAGKLGGGVQRIGNKGEVDTSLTVSDRFQTGVGEIAVVLSGTYYHRSFLVDNFENTWAQVARDTRPGSQDRYWAATSTNKFYRFTNTNWSGSGRVDWRINDRHRLFASAVYTALTENEARDRFVFNMAEQQSRLPTGTTACAAIAPPAAGTTGYADICTGNTPQAGTVYGIPLTIGISYKDFLQSVSTNTLGGDHEIGDWNVQWRANYTRALDDRSIPNTMTYATPAFGTNGAGAGSRVTVGYDYSNPLLSRLSLYTTQRSTSGVLSQGGAVSDVSAYPLTLTGLSGLKAKDVTDAYTGKLVLSRNLSLLGHESVLTFGGQYDRRTKIARERSLKLSTAQAAAAGITTDYASELTDSMHDGGLSVGYQARYFDLDTLLANLAKAEAAGDYAPNTANYYRVSEEVLAGFAMLKTTFDWGNVVAGARVEKVSNEGRAFVTLAGVSTPILAGNDRTLVFPSLHANVNLDSSKVLRLSLNTGAARPDYSILRPNFTYSDTGQTVSGGNPQARPERAKGVDLYFEWYTRPQGFISLGGFYKKLDGVLFSATGIFNSTALNSGGVDRSGYVYSTTLNGGSGELYGIEGVFQQQLEPYTQALGLPDWMGGFGVQANVTVNRGKANTPDGRSVQFPGASKLIYNVGGYYEMSGVSLRLNYQYRSPWVDAIASAAEGGDLYFAADRQLDFSSRYAINDRLEVYFDVANILNAPLRRYAGDASRPVEFARYGQRYEGGFRFNF